jgi:hypothetical protein
VRCTGRLLQGRATGSGWWSDHTTGWERSSLALVLCGLAVVVDISPVLADSAGWAFLWQHRNQVSGDGETRART